MSSAGPGSEREDAGQRVVGSPLIAGAALRNQQQDLLDTDPLAPDSGGNTR